MSDKLIFLSWGGDDALRIGQWLESKIFSPIYGLSTFLSAQIAPGDDALTAIHDGLDKADFAVGIMTDVALDRPWFLYEIGYLRARKIKPPLLKFGAKLPEGHPLSNVQHVDGFEVGSLEKLIRLFLNGVDGRILNGALERLEMHKAGWEDVTAPLKLRQAKGAGMLAAATRAVDTILAYKRWNEAAAQPCMLALASKSLEDTSQALRGLMDRDRRTYRVDYRRYPEYLIELQKTLRTRVRAVAVVDNLEEFWAHKTGDEILKTTNDPGSQRIFVFENELLLERYFSHLLQHASRYTVFVLSARDFAKVRHRIQLDFSVIEAVETHDAVAAYYDSAAAFVEFSGDPQVVEAKSSIFRDLLRWSHRVDAARARHEGDRYMAELSAATFAGQTGQHSSVIPIELYDSFEEDHPFYREMHDCMLSAFRKLAPCHQQEFRILEVGAGTGLFTKRLAQQPYTGMSILALEPDTEAHPLLLRKLHKRMHIVHISDASILTFRNDGESFQFIVSSFSEHHIRPEDKAQYFHVLLHNLAPNGRLIIGDEFLPPFHWGDDAEYEKALEAYHGYIIQLALDCHHFEVADLERYALESGRPSAPDRIDYKVSLPWYVEQAKAAGFRVEEHVCISPRNQADQVGQVGVLTLSRA